MELEGVMIAGTFHEGKWDLEGCYIIDAKWFYEWNDDSSGMYGRPGESPELSCDSCKSSERGTVS